MEFVENARELFEVIQSFKKLTHRNLFFEEMNFSEIMVCGILMHKEKEELSEAKIQLKDLSDMMKISRPALNTIINRLEEKDLVVRFREKGDRKSVFVRLTEKSQKIYEQEHQNLVLFMNNLVMKMGSEDTKKLIELLTKLHGIAQMEVKKSC